MEMTIAAANITENKTQEFEPQALRGFMTNEEWDQLLARADYLCLLYTSDAADE